jgi:hypothetical protein
LLLKIFDECHEPSDFFPRIRDLIFQFVVCHVAPFLVSPHCNTIFDS